MADNLSITKVLDPRLRTDIDNEYIAVIGAGDNWVKYRFGASALYPTLRWLSTTSSSLLVNAS